jgi:hypothetical protein
MVTPQQVNSNQKINRLAIVSFTLGLLSMIFPVTAIFYLISRGGGAGYLQSLSCGIPFTLASIIIGAIALVGIRRENQKGSWMALPGTVFGITYFVISWIFIAILVTPNLLEIAR